MRFGTEYVEAALAAQGRKPIVVDPSEIKDDLEQDMLKVLASFCTRLYGYSSRRRPEAKPERPCSKSWKPIGEKKK